MVHKITDIALTKKKRYSLFFDGVFLFSVDDETYVRNHLSVGMELTNNQLDEIKEQSEVKFAKDYALKMLSYKSYTRKMLLEKISEKTEHQYAFIAIDRMEELGLIDDLDYAMRLSRDLVNLKNYSLKKCEQELNHRGICSEYINQAIEQFSEIDPEIQIYKIVEKKYINKLSEEKSRTRAINALVRRGFGYDDIRTVIKNLAEDVDYYLYNY